MDRNEGNPFSRRQVVGGVGIGLAMVAAPPAFAQGQPAAPTAQPLQDPATRYPKPPYSKQSQPWPGLAGQMDPRRTMARPAIAARGASPGRKALITGGDSGMGRAAAIAFAREGADVAINYLPAEEPDAQEVIALIKAEGRTGLAIPGDLREEAFCQKLVADAVQGLGGLDILVSNAGRQQTHASIWTSHRAVRLDDEDQHLRAVWIIKAALPHLRPARRSSAPHRSRPTTPRPISTTMPRPRRRR